MEWLSIVTLICLQTAPMANVPMEKCEAHYKHCIERLSSMDGAKKDGLDELKISQALYKVPESRNKLCF